MLVRLRSLNSESKACGSGCATAGSGQRCRSGFKCSPLGSLPSSQCAVHHDFAEGTIIRYDGLISHFAIVVNDRAAIGYNGQQVAYEEITGIANFHKAPIDIAHAQSIVGRAKSRIGEARYHLLFQNCETFADWCYYGDARTPESSQVKYGTGTFVAWAGAHLSLPTGAAFKTAGGVGCTTSLLASTQLLICLVGGVVAGTGAYKGLNWLYHQRAAARHQAQKPACVCRSGCFLRKPGSHRGEVS